MCGVVILLQVWLLLLSYHVCLQKNERVAIAEGLPLRQNQGGLLFCFGCGSCCCLNTCLEKTKELASRKDCPLRQNQGGLLLEFLAVRARRDGRHIKSLRNLARRVVAEDVDRGCEPGGQQVRHRKDPNKAKTREISKEPTGSAPTEAADVMWRSVV